MNGWKKQPELQYGSRLPERSIGPALHGPIAERHSRPVYSAHFFELTSILGQSGSVATFSGNNSFCRR